MVAAASVNVAAIIAAGGSGTRFLADKEHAGTAKQFLRLHGRPLYAWSLLTFARHELVKRIVMVVPSQMLQFMEEEIKGLAATLQSVAEIDVVAGGTSRQASVFNGLLQLNETAKAPDYVLVHDAARPFLDIDSLSLVIEKVIEYGACTVGVPVSDTVKRVQQGKIIETIPRDNLVAVQTPQASRFKLLLEAHQQALQSGFATTDDAALLEWAGHDVYIVEGPAHNIKVTHPLDLMLAEAVSGFLLKDRL